MNKPIEQPTKKPEKGAEQPRPSGSASNVPPRSNTGRNPETRVEPDHKGPAKGAKEEPLRATKGDDKYMSQEPKKS